MANRNQKRNKKSKQNNKTSEERVRQFFVRAIAVWIFLLPLIVHFKIVDVPVQMQDLYLKKQAVDLFAYWKAVWLWVGASIFFISALVFRYVYKIGYKLNRFTGVLLAFAIWIMISYIMSPYKNVAWFGYLDRYEGTLSWLSYCMIVYAVHTFTSTKKHSLTIIKGIIFSAGVVGLIGTFQYFGLDFFKTDIAKHLMLGTNYDQYVSQLNFTMPEGTSYSTLYNPDYTGAYATIVFYLAFYLYEKTNKYELSFYALIQVLAFITIIGSGTMTSLVAFIVTGIILIFLIIVKKYKISKKTAIIILIITLGIFSYTAIVFVERYTSNQYPQHSKQVGGIEVNNGVIDVYLKSGGHFTIEPNDDSIKVCDAKGELIKGKDVGDSYLIKLSEKYIEDVIVRYFYDVNKVYVVVKKDEIDTDYIIFDYFTSAKYFSVLSRTLVDWQTPSSWGVFSNENSLSGRGYIWNRTIPIAYENILTGYGADTFSIVFPQIDLLTKSEIMRTHRKVVDKAHNLFLNIAINGGIIKLLLFVSLITYFYKNNFSLIIGITVFCILLTSVANDSVIALTSILFILISVQNKQKEYLGDRR